MNLRLNTVLWIEDQPETIGSIALMIASQSEVKTAYGGRLLRHQSDITEEVEDSVALSEIERLVNEIRENPAILNVQTAQIARAYLEQYTPGAIICDSNFPLNGAAVIEWLKKHGLHNYPLIGLSTTEFRNLSSEVQEFYIGNSARYINKNSEGPLVPRIIDGIVFSRRYAQLKYQS